MACTNHTNTTSCEGHVNASPCTNHSTGTECASHVATGSCDAHSVSGTECISHTGECLSHGGYIPPSTPTDFVEDIQDTQTKIKASHVNELRDAIAVELARRSTVFSLPGDVNIGDVIDNDVFIQLRDALVAASPWNYGSSVGDDMEDADMVDGSAMRTLRGRLNTLETSCVCDCNYACTCQCNYDCTCNCNYACTCNCNYDCTCQCNYACTCQCNYSCTCNCNYPCTCNCNYSCTCNCNYTTSK